VSEQQFKDSVHIQNNHQTTADFTMVADIFHSRLYRRSSGGYHGRSDAHPAIDGLFRSGWSTATGKIIDIYIYYGFFTIQFVRLPYLSSRNTPTYFCVRYRFQQGLYGSFVGSLMYVFLGTCKEVPMGPTAIVSLMTYNTLHGLGPVYGTLLCFLTGVIQLIMSVVGLGKPRRMRISCS